MEPARPRPTNLPGTTSSRPQQALPDIRTGWVERLLPRPWLPYAQLARLDRPSGWWLLLLPGWWAIALSQAPILATSGLGSSWPELRLLGLFLIGTVAMRGAGCTLNDIFDRAFHAAVARNRTRPIPSRARPVPPASSFLRSPLAILPAGLC